MKKKLLLANDFFKHALADIDIDSSNADINSAIRLLNISIYNYFKENYGTVKSQVDKELVEKYKEYSTHSLKKALKRLKLAAAPVNDIRYVSQLLRSKLSHKSASSSISTDDYDKHISKNFWGFVKRVVDKPFRILPSFSKACTGYFQRLFSSDSPNRKFSIPSWFPSLPQPTVSFICEPPSYEKVTRVIRRMKASGSPCPLDQISVICFKRCPFLRTVLTRILCRVWRSGNIPHEWKKACTILVHKKGNSDEPSNFRPITLETVPLKIFTSCLRDSIFSFLTQNKLIEQKIQKGFTHGVSGVLEHTSMMAYVINKARLKQRSVVITLLDLKNAFGEVHHNLVRSVLAYHHIPDSIQSLIANLYTDFHSYIISDSFSTPAIPINHGVLQGDCLSPLIFNLCFNTFIHFIKQEKYKQFGFSPHDENDRLFHPIHWFQFADDAAVVTTNERENQLLLNCFSRWCQWANMVIRVDKCTTFGIKKFSSRSLQFQPKLLINSEVVPPVKNGESFKYLGRFFNFDMDNKDHKDILLSNLLAMLKNIDSLTIHPRNKLLLYDRYVLSKISWHLTVADLGKTWISEHLDNIITKYVRQWLDLPISATISSIIPSHKNFGQAFQLPSIKFQQCQTTLRSSLKSSCDETITKLWKNTSFGTNDVYKNTKQVLKSIRNEHTNRLQSHLPSQGFIITFLLDHSLHKLNSLWSKAQSKLPANIFNFSIKYLNNTLATRKNLHLWNLSTTSDCSFCLQPESLLHIVAGCKKYLNEGRYTWRHDSALSFIAQTLQSIKPAKLYADLPGYLSPCTITGDSLRPDILLSTADNTLYIIELTVGFETNLDNNAHRKELKYRPLLTDLAKDYNKIRFVNLCISCLGIFGNSSDSFLQMCNERGIENHDLRFIISKLSTIIIRTTYYIFCMRNKAWCDPEILNY